MRVRLLTALSRFVAVAATGVVCLAYAHELPENRATLVLRDQTHLSLTLHVDLVLAAHQALAPRQGLREFLLVCAALSPDEFHKLMQRAQTMLEAETRATLNGGSAAKITGWVWPKSEKIKASIQQHVMGFIVGTSNHTHEAPFEIRAHIMHDKPITESKVQFADAFGRVLLVWYRPKQLWLTPKQTSPAIKF